MAFSAAGFHRIPHVGAGISHFVYKTTGDSLRTVASATATGYFAWPISSTGNITALSTDDTIFIMASDARGFFKVNTVASSTSSPYSTAVTLQVMSPIIAAEPTKSSDTNIVPYGLFHSTHTSTQNPVYTLDMPWSVGMMWSGVHTGASTGVDIVMGSTVAGSIESTALQIRFNNVNQGITLIAESTAKWLTLMRAQPATAILGPLVT